MTLADGSEAAAARHAPILSRSLRISLLIALCGLALALLLAALQSPGIAIFLFGALEPAAFGLAAAAFATALLVARFARNAAHSASPSVPAWWVPVFAGGAAIAAALGHFLVYHDHALSVDEFMTRFGEATLLHGDLLARIPPEWRPFAIPLQPIFTFLAPASDLWGNPYRPVTAAIHALFGMIHGGDKIANAALAGASVLLIADVARRLWPDRRDAPLLAALLMATSPQVLVASMTYYAMPAHLTLNLLWLSLFLRGGVAGHAIAAVVGVLAVGLHQISYHPLFVIPFLAPLLFSRRWPLALFYAAVYAAALLFWLFWFELALRWSGAETIEGARNGGGLFFLTHISGWMSLPDGAELIFSITNILRFLSWQDLLVLPLAIIGIARWREAPPILRQCGWGILLAVIPYVFVLPNQGHGWGGRFAHGVIGNVILFAVFGWLHLAPRENVVPDGVRRIAGILMVATVALLILRAEQVEAFVRPYAEALTFIRSQPVDVVVVDDGDIWYGADFAQNDPYLRNRPKIMALGALQPAQISELCRYRVRLIAHRDLSTAGIALRQFSRANELFVPKRDQLKACSSD